MKFVSFIFFLLIGLSLVAQDDWEKTIELEISYSAMNHRNVEGIVGFGTVTSAYDVQEESDLVTSQFLLGIVFNVDPRNSVKFSFGEFKNGRTVTSTLFINNISSEQFTDFPLTYHYFYMGANHSIDLLKFGQTALSLDNGVNVLIRTKGDETYYLPTNNLNFNYFARAGITQGIMGRVKLGAKVSFQTYLNDYFDQKILGGFKPVSFGYEAFFRIII